MKKTLKRRIKISIIAMSILMSAVMSANAAGIDQTYGSQLQNMKGFYGSAYTPQSGVNPCYTNGATGNGLKSTSMDLPVFNNVCTGPIGYTYCPTGVSETLGYHPQTGVWGYYKVVTICYVVVPYYDTCTS